jgi:hypothetical protein
MSTEAAPTHDSMIVNYCSAVLEAYGARPVPRAPADYRLPGPGRPKRGAWCDGCGHLKIEHGATGECWEGDCRCVATDQRQAAA